MAHNKITGSIPYNLYYSNISYFGIRDNNINNLSLNNTNNYNWSSIEYFDVAYNIIYGKFNLLY